ncbi:hypothetical protein NS355_08695 [Sphingomonas yabuuchiae]|uniref:Uncharacterized protein n=1 Tax=Sphingomonas yabuuchiae TaxID=172044 RepID=A0A147IT84_9SPHN|nr:hypothetical protein NS355_08695 [Sphingomonas yabuuchiae]
MTARKGAKAACARTDRIRLSATPAIEAAPNRRTIRSPVTAVPQADSASSSTAPPSSFRPMRSRASCSVPASLAWR